MNILKTSSLVLKNMKFAYLGEYSSKSDGYIEIKNEIKNLSIPTTKEDRENLQRDRNEAARDLKTALEKKLRNG